MWKEKFAFAGLFFFLGSTTSVAADEFADDESTYDGYIVSFLSFLVLLKTQFTGRLQSLGSNNGGSYE